MWETFYVLRRMKDQGLFFYNIVAAQWVRAPGNNFQFAISMDVDQQCKASKSRTQQRKILLENFLCNMICDMRVCVQSSYEIVYEDNLKGLCTQPFPFKYFRVYIREDHPTKTDRKREDKAWGGGVTVFDAFLRITAGILRYKVFKW